MDNSSNTPKMQAFDPGWNDPPKIAYCSQQTTPNRPRLNKRVAFPLSNNPSGQPAAAPMSLPPMPGVPPIPIPTLPSFPSNMTTSTPITNSEAAIDSQNTLKEVKAILLQFLESSSELGPKSNDIKRRIDVMEDMWLSGKLNTRIHQLMLELAYAIQNDCPSKADDIHKILMVDHVSCVGTWMPGIKQLIHHCIARSELLSIDKDQPDSDK